MRTAKLIIGIFSLVLAAVVMFQSCAASVGDALMDEGGTSGATGTIVALVLVVAGIIAIAARSSKGGSIAAAIFYAIAGILAVTSKGIYGDLIVWGVVALIFCAVFIISIFTQFKKVPVDIES